MNSTTAFLNKVLYAVIFLILVPGLLITWASYTENMVVLPPVHSPSIGLGLILPGLGLIAWAMLYLKIEGKGLPMNAFPPPQFVKTGPYRLFRHPIYLGFGLLVTGYFIFRGSASGLWLVTPVTMLGMVALVMGYEAIDLKKRFPDQSIATILDLPARTKNRPDIRSRFMSLIWGLGALLLANATIIHLFGEQRVLWGEPLNIYLLGNGILWQGLPILFLLLVPWFIKSEDTLRNWSINGLVAIGISTFVALLYPELGMAYLPVKNAGIYTVPVFLVLISLPPLYRRSIGLGTGFSILAIPILLVQLSYSRSAMLHLGMAIMICFLAYYHFRLWLFIKNGAEKIANSWQEWVFGKIRLINHGFYVGAGAFMGILLAGILAGDAYAWAILVFALVVILFSALWAQLIEGSEKLKRPYGYYGALVGIIFASLSVGAMGYKVWVIIGVISVVMPWVQAIGRFRCLVNGCCHGSRVDHPQLGIRYHHHRSRVCGISKLKGELLHPTPLYAMIWLFFVGFILLALHLNGISPSFIFGLYLILTGLGRFVEEAYRGEVQTPMVKGLRLYQWTAIASVLIGIVMTLIPVSISLSSPEFGWQTLVSATIGGLFTTFAMGVDFPYSNARFSRLV